jgi:hypothetical protein
MPWEGAIKSRGYERGSRVEKLTRIIGKLRN